MSASPALAQGITIGNVMGAAPVAIALGAGAFALIAVALVRRIIQDNRTAQQRSSAQVAGLRARLDEYEALLSGSREIIVMWTNEGEGPRFLGQTSALLPQGRRAEAVLDFTTWLTETDADRLARAIENLRVGGRGFELPLKALDGRTIRASGSLLGNGAALRLRPSGTPPVTDPVPAELAATASPATDYATARAVLASLGKPAFLRDGTGRLIFANAAYHDLARALGRRTSESQPAELVDFGLLQRNRAALGDPRKPQSTVVTLGEIGDYEVVDFPVNGGTAGYLHPRSTEAPRDAGLQHLSAIIDALATPIAIFSPNRELVQFNRAYRELWDLDPNWLKLGMDERAILDKLRTEGKLPNDPDYQGWRNRHLTSYQLRAPKELDPWHLPDGRTVQVIAAPAGPKGGVIYVFEDITDQLNLKSQHRAVLDVQRSTLNALTEGVAVFGTNGRLTLSNPKLSTLWKLPANLLAANPHIDQIAETSAQALPEDGAPIWRDLKRSIIDLNPTRSDRQGRINRADGKLIDYAVVRLPDGQTMMTFLDVTESANYQRVLKERNEALITADRLKDAFVQNVSYELRSPLTNIIGFADLLASGVAGELNERQASYTGYIRAASATLGVLIDNILDLATVDAGIAELQPEPQDVVALVEKARAGLTATFPEVDGQRALNLKVVIEPDLPPFVADGARIVNVLYNLLSNAARFSEPGGEVRLTVSGRTGRIQFVIEDEGAPMSEEMRQALLDRNETLAGSARQRGAGLSLSIVRAFVNMHGGTISVERREPRGTRVIISLPSDAHMAGAAE
ncbi:PAS-domain containing protein [Devosia sp. ZB163]|uniref:sensor histidine kinase n=1 Tax=Devosia sp. ZB163 TaxID=3025938 RepID=UPI002360DAE5|nr:PAS domain-containing sensor histidine kinase [Devosia sp. ZB163]MDC9822919.1 PAS-domain containing protein [Devosia sp. ZB163]